MHEKHSGYFYILKMAEFYLFPRLTTTKLSVSFI